MGKGAGAGRRGKKPHAAGRQFDPRHLEKELHAERRTGPAEHFPAELLAELNRSEKPKGYTVHHCGCAQKKDTKGPRDRYGRLK